MAKFNFRIGRKTTNAEGHVAYGMEDKEKLLTQVLTSFVNEEKFYGDNTEEMKQVILRVIKTDPQFVSNLAVFARREFHMRSVAHVLTAYLAYQEEGKPFVRRTVKGVSLRGDDVTEIMSFYLSAFGKPVPNSLKKGIGDVMRGFDEYTLAKYKGSGKAVKMRDLLCLCRPKPKDAQQAALWKRCLEDKLAVPETWETELSAHGNNQQTWEKLIDSGKVGYMALLRNLRNILMAQPYNLQKVLDTISDPAAVRASRQLPFRYLSAYLNVYRNPMASSRVIDALEEAMDASVENIPRIPGKTVIAIDVSGSMQSPISRRSDVLCSQIAMLLGMLANRICEDAVVYTFDTEIRQYAVSRREGILSTVTLTPITGGGTNMSLPFEKMLADHIKADRIIFFSDNMCNCGVTYYNKKTVQTLADEYRRVSGNSLWVHAIDLQGYGTQQFHGPRTNIMAGWSEKVFDFILLAEQGTGTMAKRVTEYTW